MEWDADPSGSHNREGTRCLQVPLSTRYQLPGLQEGESNLAVLFPGNTHGSAVFAEPQGQPLARAGYLSVPHPGASIGEAGCRSCGFTMDLGFVAS